MVGEVRVQKRKRTAEAQASSLDKESRRNISSPSGIDAAHIDDHGDSAITIAKDVRHTQ